MRDNWRFRSLRSSFGLNSEHKAQIHETLFQLIYYGQGFTHDDVYNLPIHIRNFYVQKLIETKTEEKKQMDKASKKPTIPTRR